MADQLQLRGGTTAEHATFTGALREVTVDTDKDTIVIHDNATVGGRPLLREDGSNSALALGSATSPSLKWDANTGIYSPGADQVAISTNGTGRLFVGSDGSVGVGGGNLATVPLLVQDTGNGVVIQNAASGNYAIGLLAGAGSQDAYVYQRANAPLIFGTNNTERLRLTSAGLLGLGTSAPEDALHLASGNFRLTNGAAFVTANSLIRSISSFAGAANQFETTRISSLTGAFVNRGEIAFSTGDDTNTCVERVRIDYLGRVGIGTTSPTNKFNVVSSGVGYEIDQTSLANTNLLLSYDRGAGAYRAVANYYGGTFSWVDGATERARIDSSGRLLIGTSSDSGGSLLQVNDNRIRVATAKTPASATDTGAQGEICWDADYLYVCTATNTWKRAALSTW